MSVQNIKGSVSKLPVVDNTLTRSGYSADAKATGDAIAENKQRIESEAARLDSELDVERGKIDQIANNQIPVEYLEAAVDKYVKDNEAGLATKAALETVESELKSDLNELNNMGEYANYYDDNKTQHHYDIITATGELSYNANYTTKASAEIRMDFTKPIVIKNSKYSYAYCYSDDAYLGAFNTNGNATIIADTHPNTTYIRVLSLITDTNVIVQYSDTAISGYYPYTPIEGWFSNTPHIPFLSAYAYRGKFDIDTANNKITYTGEQNCYLVCSNGEEINTGITSGTETSINLANDCVIVWDRKEKLFKAVILATTRTSDYIVICFYDNGKIHYNMGDILVNGKATENSVAINEVLDSISTETSARVSADNAINARIDNLVAPTGNSVAEVVDARTDNKGNTYASLSARLLANDKRNANVLTVGYDKMYQTIKDAVNASSNGDIILVDRGVYHESLSVNNGCNLRNKCVSIIGVSKKECILTYENGQYGLPPLEMGMGVLENMTILATDEEGHGAYCMHTDFLADYQANPPVSNYLYCHNVDFINESNDAVGIGLRKDFTLEFDNCHFEVKGNGEPAFYAHSSTSEETSNAKLICRDCTFVNNDTSIPTIKLEAYFKHDGGCEAIFQRNIAINNGGGSAFDMIDVNKWGSATAQNWHGVPDWIVSKTSCLNNITDIDA